MAGQNYREGRALRNHTKIRSGELDFRNGDLLKLYGNHWDGYLFGALVYGDEDGLLPAFKVENIIKSHNFSSKVKV